MVHLSRNTTHKTDRSNLRDELVLFLNFPKTFDSGWLKADADGSLYSEEKTSRGSCVYRGEAAEGVWLSLWGIV